MIHRILVPLDGSALAESILPCVQEFAHLTGAEVTLLQAAELPAIPATAAAGTVTGLAVELEAAAAGVATYRLVDEYATMYLATVAEQLARDGIVAHTRVVDGPAAEEIIATARDFDLVAMATHGRSGIGRWVYGSVADKVLRSANVPVLLVRVGQDRVVATGYPRRIVVPLDGSALAEGALPLATMLARRAAAELVLVRAVGLAPQYGGYAYFDVTGAAAVSLLEQAQQEAGRYLAAASRRLAEEGLAVRTDLRVDVPADAILAAAAERAADLIVMTTHGRGGLGRWVYGSVADRVLQGADIPVLLVRAGVPVPEAALATAAAVAERSSTE